MYVSPCTQVRKPVHLCMYTGQSALVAAFMWVFPYLMFKYNDDNRTKERKNRLAWFVYGMVKCTPHSVLRVIILEEPCINCDEQAHIGYSMINKWTDKNNTHTQNMFNPIIIGCLPIVIMGRCGSHHLRIFYTMSIVTLIIRHIGVQHFEETVLLKSLKQKQNEEHNSLKTTTEQQDNNI